MELIRTSSFTKAIAKLKVTDAELVALETEIATNPHSCNFRQRHHPKLVTSAKAGTQLSLHRVHKKAGSPPARG
jgi:hypothetical protein